MLVSEQIYGPMLISCVCTVPNNKLHQTIKENQTTTIAFVTITANAFIKFYHKIPKRKSLCKSVTPHDDDSAFTVNAIAAVAVRNYVKHF